MNRTSSTPQGMTLLSDMILHVDNALIEEVVTNTGETGYVLISFEVIDEKNMIYSQEIRLNVGDKTIIIDENGIPLNLYDLEEGMQVDADFSAMMTRSIPPQSNAFRIVLLQEEASVNMTTDRVVSVDTDNGFLFTGNPYDMNDQMAFNISKETVLLDQEDEPITLEEIQPGQLVQVEHATFQTMSIPPQSPAYRVKVL